MLDLHYKIEKLFELFSDLKWESRKHKKIKDVIKIEEIGNYKLFYITITYENVFKYISMKCNGTKEVTVAYKDIIIYKDSKWGNYDFIHTNKDMLVKLEKEIDETILYFKEIIKEVRNDEITEDKNKLEEESRRLEEIFTKSGK